MAGLTESEIEAQFQRTRADWRRRGRTLKP